VKIAMISRLPTTKLLHTILIENIMEIAKGKTPYWG
jgi:hypothetical protein